MQGWAQDLDVDVGGRDARRHGRFDDLPAALDVTRDQPLAQSRRPTARDAGRSGRWIQPARPAAESVGVVGSDEGEIAGIDPP